MPHEGEHKLSHQELLNDNEKLIERLLKLESDLEQEKANALNNSSKNSSFNNAPELCELVFDNAADGILVGNLKGEMVKFNRSFLKLTGYSKESLQNKHIKILFPQDELEGKPLQFSKLNEGVSVVRERLILRADGSKVLIEMNSQKMSGDNGYVAIFRDLTERVKTQEVIAESSERYKNLSELSKEGLVIHDNGIALEVNQAMINIFGYSREELIGVNIVQKLAVEDYWRILYEKMLSPSSGAYEIEGIRKNGERFFGELEGRDINYDNRALRVVTIRDISLRKKIEHLYSASLKLHGLTDEFDFEGIIKWLLFKLLAMFDSKASFVYLKSCETKKYNVVFWANAEDKFIEDELDCIADKTYSFKEVTCSDNKIFDGGFKVFDIPDSLGVDVENSLIRPVIENNEVRIVVGVFNKVSGYNTLDNKIFLSIVETLWVVLERHRLQESFKVANASKSKFLSIIAHDLRSPISSITSMLKLISDNYEEYDEESLRGYLRTLSDTSESTLSLLNNLLQWARTQTNSLEITHKELSAKKVFESEYNVLLQAIENKELFVNINVPDDILLFADPNTLKTVFRNILSNSIKFTPRNGNIDIDISQYNEKYALIRVKDSGIGMNSDEVEKIFDISEEFSKAGTEDEKGSGLGLVLCMEFVKLNKGRLWVESKKGEGSTFYFTIPLYN